MSEETKTASAAIVEPPAPSEMAHRAISEHLQSGGSVFDPRTGKSLAGTRNIAVGIAPEHAVVHNRPPTAEEHDSFVTHNHDILSKHVNSAVRTVHDPSTGVHQTDIVGLTPSKTAAMELAKHLGEPSIHNLATEERTPTGATEQKFSHVPVDKRFEHLRQNSPKREPYAGTHFSDKKLDKIEGSRRGEIGAGKMPPTNADATRVHLGTKTGKGVDAPAGFYSVKAGESAPAFAASKPHSHPVRGQFAFAGTDHPVFQAGYIGGVHHAAAAGGIL